jgi:hypothetical protein
MRPFQFLDHPALMDMLAYVTARYTKLFASDMVNNDYIACRELLELLQKEVEARSKRDNDPHGTDNDIHLSQPL